MDSAVETSVIPTDPIQNGESHLEAEVRPEVSDTASKTTSSHEKVAEIAPKITEKATQKSEVKPVKSNKKLKEEEKKLKLLFKSFEDMENPEAKLDALGRKYLQLASEHKITEARKEEFEKRLEKVVRERDQLQSDFNKASLAKNKLESLCRELLRHSKLVKEESQLRSQEEEAKRKELSEKFQTTINDISEQMQENYNDLAARLKGLVEQYEVREEVQVENISEESAGEGDTSQPTKKPKVDEVQELLSLYQRPDWLMCTVNRISPYVPQIGDEVYYLRQGHELYVKEVMATKCYEINPKKQCFYKLRLKGEELCRIVSLHFSAGPPTLCCLKLALINPETGSATGASFTVKYHHMPDVLDFLILRQAFDISISRNWRPGDRFRSVIDETWWAGEITDRSPFQSELPDSHFQCFTVRWDTGEVERMCPWDLQPVTERDPGNPDLSAQDTDASGAATSNIPLTDEERLALAYEPDEETEWLGEGREEMTQRLVAGLEALSQLNFAGPFVYPVDVQAYPDYWTVVPYPTDLSTIREKVLNKYYRRVVSLLWEVKQLERNARLYNEEESQTVRNSAKLVSVLNEFIRNSSCNDILSLCEDEEAMDVGDVEVQVENISKESAGEGDTSQDSAVPGSRKRKRGSNSEGPNKQIKREQPPSPPVEPWMQSAHELLDFLVSREDATPFRHPVDLNEFPDYTDVISEPMDFSTVYRRLEDNLYNDPEAFVRDVRLIFSNSRANNTLPRSRIYSMTIRLSAMFEDRVDSVLRDWYESASGGARRTRLRTQRLQIY